MTAKFRGINHINPLIIPLSLVVMSIVSCWIFIYRNWAIEIIGVLRSLIVNCTNDPVTITFGVRIWIIIFYAFDAFTHLRHVGVQKLVVGQSNFMLFKSNGNEFSPETFPARNIAAFHIQPVWKETTNIT